MGYRCCRTGYDNGKNKTNKNDNETKIGTFKFLDENRSPEKRKQWILRIPRKDWAPTENSRLCEKHFLPHDFQGDRQDKTRGLQKKRGELKKKKLKTGVIPSVWPNLPRHLSREPVTPRPTNATSTSRELLNTSRENERQEADSFNTLIELVEKFPLDDMRYIVIKVDTNMTFSCLDVEHISEVKCGLKVLSNLSYEMWCKGLHVKPKQIEEEPNKLPKQITSFMVLSKILLLLEKRCDDNMREMLNEEDLIEEVMELLKNPKLSCNKKIGFLMEPLSLVYRKPVHRRNSSSLLAIAVVWQKISPAAYKHIYQEGILTLPTERRIRQLTSAIGVDMELGESTKAYLRARKSKLQSKDLVVSVLIDEIYTSRQVQCVNGKFYGNEEGSVTKTLLCFMIKSVAGKYRDIIAMLPCSTLNGNTYYLHYAR